MLPEVIVFGREDDDSDEEVGTEVETISAIPLVDMEGADDNDDEAEESGIDVEEVSEAAAVLKGVDVREGCAALLVEGPVPLGTT